MTVGSHFPSSMEPKPTIKKINLLKKVTIFILKNKKQDHLENTLGVEGKDIDFFLFLG